MSRLVCPLCGRLKHIKCFNPSGLERDILAVKMKGMGRGKGVKVVGRYSLLSPNNEVTVQIKDRILVLVNILYNHGYLHPEEMSGYLPSIVDPRGFMKRDQIIANLSNESVILKRTINQLKDSATDETEKDIVIEDFSEKHLELSKTNQSLRETLEEKSEMIEGLSASNIKLNDEVESIKEKHLYRLGQARELLKIAKTQEDELEDLRKEIRNFEEVQETFVQDFVQR